MGWLIFLAIVGAYWVIGIRRIPIYFRRIRQQDQKRYPYVYKEFQKEAAFQSLILASIWPYYEGGRWVLDRVIKAGTAEERREAEYEKAARIVAEYKADKERREREAFDRQLRGDA